MRVELDAGLLARKAQDFARNSVRQMRENAADGVSNPLVDVLTDEARDMYTSALCAAFMTGYHACVEDVEASSRALSVMRPIRRVTR